MTLRTLSAALLLSIVSISAEATVPSDAHDGGEHVDHGQRWQCVTADGAKQRREEVERSLYPPVAFVGEAQAASVEARMAAHKVPAFSVAIIHDGKLDWSASWGRLQHEGAPAGCDSLFQAGSLAKPVTVLAALRMQHAGVLDLDADVGTYLTSWRLPPGRQSSAHPVTLRNLFAHTAGITPGGYAGYGRGEPIPTDKETVDGAAPSNAHKVEVLEVPGVALRYSGGGYTVAEIALQDKQQQPFERIMREWLLGPVGMQQADFSQPLRDEQHAHAALGHLSDGSAVAGGWHDHPEQAAAGLWATASDLAQLLIELRKGWLGQSEVFNQTSVRELLATPVDGHSYGFRLIGDGKDVFITHYGGTAGFRAGMTLNFSTGNGAVYLVNSNNGSNLGAEFLASVSKVYGWPVFRQEQEQVKRTTQTAAVLQSLAGRYQFADGPTVEVVHDEDALTVVFPNGDRYLMAPIVGALREFIHPATGVRASFGGNDEEVVIHLYGQTALRVNRGE